LKQITVLVENKVGALADVCEKLGNVGINLEAISAQGEDDHGVIRIITTDDRSATNLLQKAGYRVIVGDVMTFKVNDAPGELAKTVKRIARSGVNIECIYLLNKGSGFAEFALKSSDNTAAEKSLKR